MQVKPTYKNLKFKKSMQVLIFKYSTVQKRSKETGQNTGNVYMTTNLYSKWPNVKVMVLFF